MNYFADDGCMVDMETDQEDDEVEAEQAHEVVDAVIKHEHRDVDNEDVKLFPSREVQRNHWYRTTMSAFALQDSYRIPDDSKPTPFHRVNVICKVLGGSVQPTFTRGRDGHDMLFAKLEQTPFLPRGPGESGLLFTFSWRAKSGPTSIVRLFIRDPHETKWLYMGEYKNKETRAMTCQEWNMLPEPVKALRVQSLVKRKYPEAEAIRARIVEYKKVEAESNNKAFEHTVTNEDIRNALDDGREHMLVIALQCVGYESSVQKRLSDFASALAIVPPKPTSRRAKRKKPTASDESEEDQVTGHSGKHARPETSPPASASSRRQPARTVRRRVVYAESESE